MRSSRLTPWATTARTADGLLRVEGFSYFRVVYDVVGTNITVYQVRHTSRRPSKRFGP